MKNTFFKKLVYILIGFVFVFFVYLFFNSTKLHDEPVKIARFVTDEEVLDEGENSVVETKLLAKRVEERSAIVRPELIALKESEKFQENYVSEDSAYWGEIGRPLASDLSAYNHYETFYEYPEYTTRLIDHDIVYGNYDKKFSSTGTRVVLDDLTNDKTNSTKYCKEGYIAGFDTCEPLPVGYTNGFNSSQKVGYTNSVGGGANNVGYANGISGEPSVMGYTNIVNGNSNNGGYIGGNVNVDHSNTGYAGNVDSDHPNVGYTNGNDYSRVVGYVDGLSTRNGEIGYTNGSDSSGNVGYIDGLSTSNVKIGYTNGTDSSGSIGYTNGNDLGPESVGYTDNIQGQHSPVGVVQYISPLQF